MKISRTWAWVGAVAATAVAGTAAVFVYRRAKAEPMLGWTGPAQQQLAEEPPEGYQARWQARGTAALTHCQDDEDVQSFAQAVTCALNLAFPEAAPWTDPAVSVTWAPWMQAAAALVESDLLRSTSRDGSPPQSWEIELWLRGETEIAACRARRGISSPRIVARCAARRIYPSTNWDAGEPWMEEFISALTMLARQR